MIAIFEIEYLHFGVYDMDLLSNTVEVVLIVLLDRRGRCGLLELISGQFTGDSPEA